MAKPKATAAGRTRNGNAAGTGTAGPADSDDDPALGSRLAVGILIRELRLIAARGTLDHASGEGERVALYARVLSQVAKDGRTKDGDLARKSTDELLELAMAVPELRDALGARR
jgi:hypothetical protein